MKAGKAFGILFTIMGSMTVFLALGVLILPLIANEQMSLVLNSFYQSSEHFLVNAMNKMMTFMLENSVLTLVGGIGLLLVGILLLLSVSRYEEEQAVSQRTTQRIQNTPIREAPVWQNRAPKEQAAPNPFAVPLKEYAVPEQNQAVGQEKPQTLEDAQDSLEEQSVPMPFVTKYIPAPPSDITAQHNEKTQLQNEPFTETSTSEEEVFSGSPKKLPRPQLALEASPETTSEGHYAPLFSVHASSEKNTVPTEETKTASNPQKQKIKIKSTMGKHTL